MAFDWEFTDIALAAGKWVTEDTWDLNKNASEMVRSQVECCFYIAQSLIEQLSAQKYDIAFKESECTHQEIDKENIKAKV